MLDSNAFVVRRKHVSASGPLFSFFTLDLYVSELLLSSVASGGGGDRPGPRLWDAKMGFLGNIGKIKKLPQKRVIG